MFDLSIGRRLRRPSSSFLQQNVSVLPRHFNSTVSSLNNNDNYNSYKDCPTTKLMEGMKVVELASVLAGPTVCQFLAELGADVIKIENTTTKGDVTRTWKLANDEQDSTVTAYFSCCNLGKRSLAVNLKDPRGLKIIHKIVEDADVVVASYKPGDAEKLQVDYKTLSEINPKLIYAQITGYGLNDDRAGYDAVIQAESGFQFMNGEPEPSPPTKMPVAFMDLLAAHQIKEALLVNLWRRERNGNKYGSFVDVSLLASGVSALANQGTGYLVAGTNPKRIGSDHPSICPYGTIFKCKDGGLITLAVGSDKQYQNLCKVLGQPELGFDKKFSTNPTRVKNREECKNMIQTLIERFDRPDLLRELRMNAVPAGGVNEISDVFEQPQAEELVVRNNDGAALGVRQIAFNTLLYEDGMNDSTSRTEEDGLLPPPQYGQHTKNILMEDCQYTNDEIEQLLKHNVVEEQ
jgi:crotonobetainyl-CoA:carnitine CoA-transferase CaiB-like acyl-CoA transferase